MIELVSDGIIPNTHNKTWLIDTVSELSQLEVEFGNEAYCITDQTTYICNGQGNWVEKGGGGGGSSVEVEPLSVTTNGDYDAGEGKAYNPVNVGVIPALVGKSIIENGSYHAFEDGVDGYDSVEVSVAPHTESLYVNQNGSYHAFEDGVDGYDSVEVSVAPHTESLYVNQNGTYTPGGDVDGFSYVEVEVQSALGDKTIDSNGTYYAADDGLDGYSSVTVSMSGSAPTQFTSSGTIGNPTATAPAESLLRFALASHKFAVLSIELDGNTGNFPLTVNSNNTVSASLATVIEGVVSTGFLSYMVDLFNGGLLIDYMFLSSCNTDGTDFVDMTSMFPISTPATITGYYWN